MSNGPSDDSTAGTPAGRGDNAPLKLEGFLPYRLNVVASLVSQALAHLCRTLQHRRAGMARAGHTGQYGMMTARRSAPTATCTRPGFARGRAAGTAQARRAQGNRADLREHS
jgi:hypothetical protein